MVQHYKFIYIIIFVAIISAVSTYAINTGIKSETRGFEVVPVQHFTTPISANWSLISTPYELVNSSTKSIVNSISGKNWTLKSYDGYGWKTAYFDVPDGAWTLDNIGRIYGYYIKLNASSTLEIDGVYINKTTIPLKQGWNMIGYPSNTSKNLATAMSSIGGKWTMLFALYNNTWTMEDPKTPPFPWEIKNLDPGRGYWINISNDTPLIIKD